MCQRVRPDIHTAVAFLCTGVNNPDTNDYKKLTRVIKYLQRTEYLKSTIQDDSISNVQWWVDGAFAVHNDMCSHTHSYMSLDNGMIKDNSTKQKINTHSSIKSELVVVYDTLPTILWILSFFEACEYLVK